MRRLLYAVILVALCFAPVERLDIAKLMPVDAVALYREAGYVVLETNTGARGRGETCNTALQALKKSVAKVVYLDTATTLLVSEEALLYVDGMRPLLKQGVNVYICKAEGQVEDMAKYMKVHGTPTKLREWKTSE